MKVLSDILLCKGAGLILDYAGDQASLRIDPTAVALITPTARDFVVSPEGVERFRVKNTAAGVVVSAHVVPVANNTHDVGSTSFRYRAIYGVDGNYSGTMTIGTIANDSTSNAFLTSASGVVKYRNAAQVLSDIGGMSSTGSFYLGTTLISLSRSSAAQSLTGINIDGTAGSETLATVTARGATTAVQTSFTGGVIVGNSVNLAVTGQNGYQLGADATAGGFYIYNSTDSRYDLRLSDVNGAATFINSVTATNFIGPGTGLTGTAGSLNIGGNAATATLAANSTLWNGQTYSNVSGNSPLYFLTNTSGSAWDYTSVANVIATLGGPFLPLTAGSSKVVTSDIYLNHAGGIGVVFKGNTTDAYIYNVGSTLRFADNNTVSKGFYIDLTTGALTQLGTGAFTWNGTISGSSFTGAGTGLTGTASSLNIGGNSATATLAANSTLWNGYSLDVSATYSTGFDFLFARTTSSAQGRLITAAGLKAWAGYYTSGDNPTFGTVTGNITGTAASETLATVTGRGASTSTQTSFTGGIIVGNSLNIAITGQDGYQLGADATAGGFYIYNTTDARYDLKFSSVNGAATFINSVTATNFIGPGTGLTGTAGSLSIGGNAATATLATNATNPYVYLDNTSSGNYGLVWASGTGAYTALNASTSKFYANPSTGVLTSVKFLATNMAAQSSGSVNPVSYNGSTGALEYLSAAQMQSFLSLGSNAYTSTAYVPYTGASTTVDLGNQLLRFNSGFNIYSNSTNLRFTDNGGTNGFYTNLSTGAFTQLGSGLFTWNGTIASIKAGTNTVDPGAYNGSYAIEGGYSQLRSGTAHDFNIDVYNSASPINAFKINQNSRSDFFTNQTQAMTFNSTASSTYWQFGQTTGGYYGYIGFGTSLYSSAGASDMIIRSDAKLILANGNSNDLSIHTDHTVHTLKDLYVGSGVNTQMFLDRANSSGYSQFNFTTNGTANWAMGMGVSQVSTNWELYNFTLGTYVMRFTEGTGASQFASSITATSFNTVGVLNINSGEGYQLGRDATAGGFYVYNNSDGRYDFILSEAGGAATLASTLLTKGSVTIQGNSTGMIVRSGTYSMGHIGGAYAGSDFAWASAAGDFVIARNVTAGYSNTNLILANQNSGGIYFSFGSGNNDVVKGYFDASGNFYAQSLTPLSDMRLKDVIQMDVSIIAGIEKLKPHLYYKSGRTELGYFAQEAQSIIPYAVHETVGGYLGLSYNDVFAAKIDRLETIEEKQERRIAQLERQVVALGGTITE